MRVCSTFTDRACKLPLQPMPCPHTVRPTVAEGSGSGAVRSDADGQLPHHLLVQVLGHRVPGLVVLDVAVVGVVGAVADAPAVVGHKDGGVRQVAHEVVQGLVVGEALVAAAGRKLCKERVSAKSVPSVFKPQQITTAATLQHPRTLACTDEEHSVPQSWMLGKSFTQ